MALLCAGCGRTIALQDALCPRCGRFVLGDLPAEDVRQREARRGPALILVLAFAIGIFVGPSVVAGLLEEPKPPPNAVVAPYLAAIQGKAERWVNRHPAECPTVQQLQG